MSAICFYCRHPGHHFTCTIDLCGCDMDGKLKTVADSILENRNESETGKTDSDRRDGRSR